MSAFVPSHTAKADSVGFFLCSPKPQCLGAITKGACSGVMFKLKHYTNRGYARLCFQMAHFCNTDATTMAVGCYQIDPWMFLYEAYFNIQGSI